MEIPKMEAAQDNLIKNQWGRFLYKKDGRKSTLLTKRFILGIVILFFIIMLCLLFQGGVETGIISQSAIPLPILSNTEQEKNLDIPRLRESGPMGGQTATGHKGARAMKLSAPQLIVRQNAKNIPPGLFAKATLISGASNGLVRAELSENLEFNGEVFIEAGTILVGHGQSNEERLIINFDKIVLKDGAVESVSAQACDMSDKIVGLKGSKLGSHALKVAGGVGLGFVGGLSEGLQDSHSENGAVVHDPSLRNAMLNGAATAALEESRDMITSMKDKVPVIEVKVGTPICVITE